METMRTMSTCSGSKILMNGQINIQHVLVRKRLSPSLKAISLPKGALFSHSNEILRKISLMFFFLMLLSTHKKRSTSASLLRLKPFRVKSNEKINTKLQKVFFKC